MVVSKEIQLPRALTVKELGDTLNVSAVEIIKELMKNGVMASINQVIDFDTAAIVASEHDLDPPLANLMVAVGLILSFFTLSAWWYLWRAV